MKILGFHLGHDSAAAMVVDGEVIAHAAEERFTRMKHYGGLPVHAMTYCLERAGCAIEDLDAIAATVSPLHPGLEVLLGMTDDDVAEATKGQKGARWSREAIQRRVRQRIRTPQIPPAYLEFFRKPKHVPFIRVDHHIAHAECAYQTSGFDDCLVVTADGIGDGTSTAIWRGRGGRLEPLRRFGAPGSLGWFYGMVTEALGWQVGDGEGKTMGLAPYGDPHAFDDAELNRLIPGYADGELTGPVDFGQITNVRIVDTDHWHFVNGTRVAALVEKHGPENVAAKAQHLLEEQMVDFLQQWIKREQATRMATGGGVFLNVKVNQEVVERGLVEDYHIFPDAGDPGLPVGAALHVWRQRTGERAPLPALRHVYWGPEFASDEIEQALQTRNLPYRRSSQITEDVAQMLADGKIVGWFQGRAESGPRALGARSILMDPRKAENKDIINARVKYREAFRPFCPSMTAEGAKMYLTTSHVDRFMICASSVTDQAMRDIPAVVHVDNTVRPQVVGDEAPRYRDLIERFGSITGVPVLLNTSFNIKGEAIVSTPSDAIKCFFDTGMDVFAIDDFFVSKS